MPVLRSMFVVAGMGAMLLALLTTDTQAFSHDRPKGRPWPFFRPKPKPPPRPNPAEGLVAAPAKRDFAHFKAHPVQTCQHGGWKDRKGKATGFYHVEKQGNRWWLVDPDGCFFYFIGANEVRPHAGVTAESSPHEGKASVQTWAEEATGRMRKYGFNGLGYRSEAFALSNVSSPLSLVIEGTSGLTRSSEGSGFMRAFIASQRPASERDQTIAFPNDCLPVFHPDFEAFCERHAHGLAAFKANPNVLGYFSDVDLPLPQLDRYLALDANDPLAGSSHAAAKAWLAKRKPGNSGRAGISAADREAWIEHVYDRYFEITTRTIRKYDPHHLCFGTCFSGDAASAPGAFRAAGRHLDLVSVSLSRAWEASPRSIKRWTDWSGKPVFISEWCCRSLNAFHPLGSPAKTPAEALRDMGLLYQSQALDLLKSPNCVGWSWCKFQDKEPEADQAKPSGPEAVGGLLNAKGEPQVALLRQMRLVHQNAYMLTEFFDAE